MFPVEVDQLILEKKQYALSGISGLKVEAQIQGAKRQAASKPVQDRNHPLISQRSVQKRTLTTIMEWTAMTNIDDASGRSRLDELNFVNLT